jgi:hypothetical protein
VSAGAAAALCALGLAVAAGAPTAPPEAARALGERGQAMAAYHSATSEPKRVAVPHGADREDALVVASDPAMVWGRRWAAEAHRIAQSMTTPASRSEGVSFDWRDAGAGALAALGLVALLGIGAYGLRSRATRPTARGA